MASGLAVAAVVAGATILPVQAQNFLDGLFSGGGGIFGAPQPQAPQPQYAPPDGGGVSFDRRRRRHASSDEDGERAGGHNSICVRLCDGYTFPLGTYHGSSDTVAQEAVCRSACPSAETALFLTHGGDDPIEGAVRVDGKMSYAKLPNAFKYKTKVTAACTCHAQGGNRVASLLRDFTLRTGDAVMTDHGLKIFHGGEGFPFKPGDFLALARSRDVPKQNRPIFEAMNRARQLVPPTFEASELTVFRKKPNGPVRRAEPRKVSDRGAT